MTSAVINTRSASRRRQSLTRRWTSGRGRRRRSGRGGKSSAGTTTPTRPKPLRPRLPDQEAGRPPHADRMPVEPGPGPTLGLVPAPLPLGLLGGWLDPVPPVRGLHQSDPRLPRPEVAPVVLAPRLLAARRASPDPPAEVAA